MGAPLLRLLQGGYDAVDSIRLAMPSGSHHIYRNHHLRFITLARVIDVAISGVPQPRPMPGDFRTGAGTISLHDRVE